jgi:hypothetical protein
MSLTLKKKYIKILLVLLLAFLASLGTLVYGYRFSAYYFKDRLFQVPIGILFALAGAAANTLLGAFSLLRINQGPIKYPHSILILIVCVFSAIPMGFICFFGYQSVISLQLNIVLSNIVAIVNIAINYTAIQYFIKDILLVSRAKNQSVSLRSQSIIIGGLAYLMGFLVALAPFLATTNGANDIFIHYKLYNLYNYNVGIALGVLSFIPLACLYSHANRAVLDSFYKFMLKLYSKKAKITLRYSVILLFCFLAGVSLVQIMREFFSPDKHIPEFFKTEFMQYIAANFLLPLAWVTNVAITFYCIADLLAFFNIGQNQKKH